MPTRREQALERAATRHLTGDTGYVTPCWLSTYSTQSRNYAQVGWRENGRTFMLLAHRASWEYHRGPIPDGLTIDHLCLVKRCVNPNHLEPVTNEENHRRWQDGQSLTCIHGHFDDWRTTPAGHRRCRSCERRRRSVT